MDTQPKPPPQPNNQRINMIKLGLGCTGVSMILCTGAILLGLIVMPIVFRNLLPEQQYKIIKYVPFMSAFKPTEALVVLPTSVGSGGNALLLLASPTPGGTPNLPIAQGTGLSAGANDTDLKTDTPVPPTTVPTVNPILSSPTPVIALMQPSQTPETPAAPTPTDIPLPPTFRNTSYKWIPQGWNNCGPANLTQALQYYGWAGSQDDAANWLKPNREDKNVSPWQMVEYVRTQTGLKAIQRVAGDLALVKRLVSQKFAVILETGYDVVNEGWMGHYLTVIGYDDNLGILYGLDTWLGDGKAHEGFHEDYNDIDRRWQAFNRLYMVVYTADREGELRTILGPDADLQFNASHALSVARTEASAQPDNAFTWFNLGSSYVLLQKYKEATIAFDKAINLGGLPPRMLWYQFTPYEAYYHVRNYTNVMALAQTAITSTPYVEETFYWKGMAEAAQGKSAPALSDFKKVLQLNPNFSPATDRMQEVQDGRFSPPVVAQANP